MLSASVSGQLHGGVAPPMMQLRVSKIDRQARTTGRLARGADSSFSIPRTGTGNCVLIAPTRLTAVSAATVVGRPAVLSRWGEMAGPIRFAVACPVAA